MKTCWTHILTKLVEGGIRLTNPFVRAGLDTPRKLIEAIKTFGLQRTGDHYEITYVGKANGGIFVRQASTKSWNKVLGILKAIGFDWEEYCLEHYGLLDKSEFEIKVAINNKVDELIDLLKIYLQKQ